MKDPGARKTQVITFPHGGIVEYNGKQLGRGPASITLPQDEEGRLTGRAVIRAIPKDQPHLITQSRILEPRERETRVPDRILIDMTGYMETNFLAEAELPERQPKPKERYRYIPRSKPTQVIGIDREHMRDTTP